MQRGLQKQQVHIFTSHIGHIKLAYRTASLYTLTIVPAWLQASAGGHHPGLPPLQYVPHTASGIQAEQPTGPQLPHNSHRPPPTPYLIPHIL